jgi:hypothetical protein
VVSLNSSRPGLIRLKEESAGRHLKQLAGQLTLQADLANETLARIDKVMNATGRSVGGANGGTLSVQAIRKVGDDIEVEVTMENLTPNPFGGRIFVGGGNVVIRGNVAVNGNGGFRINGLGSNSGGEFPDLLDARGEKYQLVGATSDGMNIANGTWSRTVTLLYHPGPNQTAPADLVLFGTRTHTIGVPFQFQDVPLP